MTSVPEYIAHYQKSIEKSENDTQRLLHCIGKLYKLAITVQHLQETGIGRTVNALRKDDGEVGVAAKALVAKWKAMVAAEESSDDDGDHNNEDDDLPPDTQNNNPNTTKPYKEIRNHHKDRDKKDLSNKHKNDKINRNNNDKHHSKDKLSESHHKSYEKENRHKISHHKSSNHKERKTNNTNCDNSGNDDIDDDDDDDDDDEEDDRLIIDIKLEKGEVVRNNSDKHDSHKQKTHKSGSANSSSDTPKSSSHHRHKSGNEEKEHRNKKSSKNEPKAHSSSSSKDKSSHSSSKNDHKSSISKSKDEHKSEKSSGKDNIKTHNKSKDAHGSNSNRIDSKPTDKEKYISEKIQTTGNQPKTNIESTPSSSKNNQHQKLKDDSISSGRKRKHESSQKSKSSDSSSKLPSTPKKPKLEEKIVDGIDSSMGTSFADALGMIIPSSSKTSLKKTSPKSATSTSSQSVTPSVKLEKAAKSEKTKKTSTPTLLSPTIKLDPLEPELAMELPTISNNYRPMPLNPIVMDCVFKNNQQPKKYMTDEEAIGASMSSKTMRTKVYSGVKTGAVITVQTLHELCIRVLQKNIDALEYTGGVPYDILKPILERATPHQLFAFEDFNPYLMDDSDVLWEQHCNRKFRSQKKREYETWRDMFLRCTEEQEHRLNSLTENIKMSQTIAVPLKQTKLAYVDSMVKPPRNIIKKQNQYGTEKKLVATPAARVAALNNGTTNIAKPGDTRLKVMAGLRDTAQVGSNAIFRPKKAPLMVKTLQLMKGRFKR